MLKCCCSYVPTSTSISKFISEQPYLIMLETKCSNMRDLKLIHAQLIKTGLIKDKIAASRVLAFCALSPACDMNYAYLVFSRIMKRNLFIWDTIIRGFSQSSFPQLALSIFIEMLESSPIQPDKLTYPSVFKAYTQLGLAAEGAQLHGRIMKLGLESDPFIRNSMLNMYVNSGFLNEARKLFEEDEVEDVVAWNSMISGLAKCGEIDDSWELFNKMQFRNDVSWNSMISGFVKNGKWTEALDLFNQMQEEGFEPSEYTVVSLLNACAFLGALEQGKWIHEYIMKTNSIRMNGIVITGLINMYCKCGNIEMARKVFETAQTKGLSCWNSMIFGLAINGFGNEAIQLFSRLQSSNLEPDSVSFLCVLTACNHSGLVDEARTYFTLMTDTYKIKPTIQHFGCIVDTLGRAGLLEEAEVLINSMPISPTACIWGSLLSSAQSHRNFEMAERAAKHLIELDQDDSSSYLLMSNAYAASGKFLKAMQERHSMKDKQIMKQPGCSSIEVDGEVHEFLASGTLHYQVNEIYSLLN
ncbi:OLC1v1023528C1 [Oldenlandia corymbosa var. corymbosa]|uniref:OLC1v1023528C1 n=1 Tax=Oldenlandia corymbosa var. corymbosa TaxID=529605 RepID=A0AAV1C076_OLDCO|nr:OLC1v1023528C1 [Oldenlandia corymbosa var. corymbosa]